MLYARSIRHRAARSAALAGLALAISCDSTAPESGPGAVRAVIESPAGAEGSAILEFVGGRIRSMRASGGELFQVTRGDTSRVILILEAPGRLEVTLEVDDVSAPPQWKILQIADGEDRLRPDPGRYRVRYER